LNVFGAVVMAFGIKLAQSRGLPNVLIILAVLVIVHSLVTTRSVFGRHSYAIGGNLNAAMLSGVKVKWVNFGVMLNMGFLPSAIVGGLIMAVMSNGMQLQGIDQSVQQVVKGIILLLAVAFDVYNKRRAGGR
jgi:putative multiple sugar transport system permease protein